jgi:Bacterial conjugation TrbI-like protein
MIMTNANRQFKSHEFDEVSEAVSNPTHHANGNGKTSTTSVQHDSEADDDLSPEEEQQLAGFNPATPQLISEEYRLKQDQESAVERPLAERASIRLGAVVAVVGTVMGTGAVLWFGFLQPRPPARQSTQSPNPTPTTPPAFDETAELKSRLAFQDQQQQLQPKPVAKRQPPAPSRRTTARPPVSTPTPVAVSPPITAFRPDPVIIRSPVTPPERTQPIERVDPFQRWAQLANVGQLRVSPGAVESSRIASNNQPDPAASLTAQPNPVIPVVSISAMETELSDRMPSPDAIPSPYAAASPIESRSTFNADMTPGMIGILNRTPAGQLDQQMRFREVALGTFTKARVIMPMIWDEGSNNSTGGTASAQENRFAVELVEDMKATNGTVALPAGTVLVIRTSAVGRGNNLVSASAIAIVYRDRSGQIRQQTLPPDSLQIRGQDNRPLIAQKLNDVGPDIARQDLLTGLLSSLGRVGTIINQPRTQSSTTTSGGNFNQSVITSSAEPQIWAAALEGFFNPIAERLSRRSDQMMQELLQRPNVQFVPEGTEVSVVVNSFLRVDR